jgi:hypothetical protein
MKTILILMLSGVGLLVSDSSQAAGSLTPEQVVAVVCAETNAQQPLSGDQIFLLMQASKGQYVSMDTTMVMRGYQYDSDRWEDPQLRYQYDVVSRWKQGWSFGQSIEVVFDETGKEMKRSKTLYRMNPSEVVCLRESPLGSITEATRDFLSNRQEFLDSLVFADWNDMVWDPLPIRLDEKALRLRMETAQVSLDDVANRYIVEFARSDSPKSKIIRWKIDPSMNYLPVVTQLLAPDKQVLLSSEGSEFHQIGGKWMPQKLIWRNILAKFSVEYSVQSQGINQPLSDSMFGIEVPKGSMVDDRIRDIRYKYVIKDPPASGVQNVEVQTNTGIVGMPSPDAELADAAIKGNMIFADLKSRSPAPDQMVLSPAFVWVLPGKNQYTLELAQGTNTRSSLSGKTISDSPLVLQAVDDQLAGSGKLIVTLERPEGHMAFADAVLTLDFAGTKTPIHFVAAPLP